MSTTTAPPALDPKARLRAAQDALRAGQTDDAVALFRAAFDDAPDASAAAVGLARALDARGERPAAQAVLRALIDTAPTHANVLAAARQWKAMDDTATLRIALTGHGTLDSLADHLRVAAAQADLVGAVYVSGFDQWAQDLLAPDSALCAFRPEVVFLRLDPDALFPVHAADPLADTDTLAAERAAGIARLGALLDAARRNLPGATLVVHTFALPEHAPLGLLDLSAPNGQRARIDALNAALLGLVGERMPQVVALDQERLEAGFGKARVRDARMWYLASIPYSDAFLPVVARAQVRILRALRGKTRKCVVLDLDNTLWGGVVGEDGPERLQVGGTAAPGNAFADFQRALDTLRRRGVLLAVCSKNNPDDALPVLESHPGMVLRREHFAALRINWRDKASNLVEIARELNIGLDSLVFLDDNPAERGQVRQRLPEVLTPEMPRDPALYARTLAELDVFDTLALTAEDLSRSRLYAEQQERHAFAEAAAGDLHAYLHGLDIVVRLAAPTPHTLPRIAQLVNKTNQFNVTTRRHTEAQVVAMAADPDWMVCAAEVADRFGDSGLTGVAIARRRDPDTWELDSFLLSCRVLGRGVEDALLHAVAQAARAAGARRLLGRFVPTPKNAPAADFFARMGFARTGEEGEETLWEMALDTPELPVAIPPWLRLEPAA